MVEGKAELLTDTRDLETLLAAENAKYGTDYGIDMLDPAVNSAYRVRPTWVLKAGKANSPLRPRVRTFEAWSWGVQFRMTSALPAIYVKARWNASGRVWPRAELRVGDADRQGAVAELQRHYVDGRLTSDELDERVAQALSARTFGELAMPLGDLPALALASPVQSLATAPREYASGSAFGPAFGALLIAIGVLALLWMSKEVSNAGLGGRVPFWPAFIFFFFFIGRPRRGSRRDRWHRGGPPTRYL